MSLSAVAVRRPVGTAILFLAVVVLGLVSLVRLPVDFMPGADFPRISITTSYPGVASAEIETLITRPVEQSVATISGVDRIEATSSEGLSRVQLQFTWGTNLDEAVNDVRSQLDRIRATLPEDADTPVIYKFDLSAFPVAWMGVSGSGDARQLRDLADETLSRRLERVPGVAAVQVRGGRVREIQVRLSASRLAGLGLSASEVTQALRRENRNVSAGDLRDAGREVVIRTVGEFSDLDAIEQTVVASRNGRVVRVRDLGEVVDTFQDIRSELWIDGAPGIQLSVSKQDGVNTVAVVDALRREVDRINREYEGVARLTFMRDSSTFIRQSIAAVSWSALAGAGLAVWVLLFFLGNLRATLVVGTTIPISVLATFGLMNGFGITLNVVSFGGLALGIGMLVDNAIVLLENIYKRREEGLDAVSAAISGSQQIAMAITASTTTTLVVFVPVLFLAGFAGIFFREMAIVVSFALACSLLVALTLVPALSAQLLGRSLKPEGTGVRARLAGLGAGLLSRVEHRYRGVLSTVLGRPWRTVGCAVSFLGAAGLLASLVTFELMPETDEGQLNLSVELPVGTPIDTTMEVMKDVEARALGVLQPHEVDNVTTSAGPRNWWRPAGSNEGAVRVNLIPRSEGRRGIEKLVPLVQEAVGEVPGARIQVRPGSGNFLLRMMRGGGDDRLSVVIRGHDLDTADALGQQVQERAQEIDGVTFARVAREDGQLERVIRIDRDRVAELGLRGTDVAETVETYLLGRVATRFRDGGDEHDVRVRLRDDERSHLEQLFELPMVTPNGGVVPLSQVARVEQGEGPTSISRENQERILRVNVGVGGRALGDVVADLGVEIRELAIPDGFQVQIGGEHEEQQEVFASLGMGLLLAVFLVYAVMAIQFESFRDPLVVMTAVPFASIGVVLALVVTATTFNMNSFLGAIVLVGIVVNNAIVLVDTINRFHRQEGLGLRQSVERASLRRLRPILMTTTTTCLAMTPLAVGIGEGSEIQAPLARVVIGGLLVSTGVTLLLVPSLYMLSRRKDPIQPTGSPNEGA